MGHVATLALDAHCTVLATTELIMVELAAFCLVFSFLGLLIHQEMRKMLLFSCRDTASQLEVIFTRRMPKDGGSRG